MDIFKHNLINRTGNDCNRSDRICLQYCWKCGCNICRYIAVKYNPISMDYDSKVESVYILAQTSNGSFFFFFQWACSTCHKDDAMQLSLLLVPSQAKPNKPTSPKNVFGAAAWTYHHLFKSNKFGAYPERNNLSQGAFSAFFDYQMTFRTPKGENQNYCTFIKM